MWQNTSLIDKIYKCMILRKKIRHSLWPVYLLIDVIKHGELRSALNRFYLNNFICKVFDLTLQTIQSTPVLDIVMTVLYENKQKHLQVLQPLQL